ERVPGGASVASAIDAKAAFRSAAELVGLDGKDEDGVWVVGMHDHGEAEIGGHAVGNVCPVGGTIVGTIKAPVILQEETIGLSGVHDDLVHALAKLRIFFGHMHDADTVIPCVPVFAGIIGSINARGGNGDVHPIGVNGVE